MSDPQQQDVYSWNPRSDAGPHIPREATSALDVGCGAGGFGSTLRAALGPQARLVGVEAVASQAEAARSQGFDEVVTGYFPQALPFGERFDLISFNDVLEHLVDPWEALRQCHEFLTDDGRILAAIPNIQYAPVSLGLLRGRWQYTEVGVLDRTHLRFFTRETVESLFDATGYDIETCAGENSVWGHEWKAPDGMGGAALMARKAQSLRRKAYLKMTPDAEFMHMIVVARPRKG